MQLVLILISDMKMLELVMALGIVPYVSYLVILPESPRWLISKGRIDEAREILATGLKMNNKPLSLLDKLDNYEKLETKLSKPKQQSHVTDLLKFSGIRRNLICMSFCWFSISMGYYGLIYNTPSFGWNIYITFCMPAFFTLPVIALQPFVENKIGRKLFLTLLMMLSGLLLLSTLTIPQGMFSHNWPIMVFAWIGTIACNTAFGAGYVYSKELFPTTHRTIALSISSACARLGAIASPYVAMLEVYDSILSLAVYGVFLLLGALTSILIWPDTKKTNIPDTLEECEEMASSKNRWLFCCKD
jgi:OCT family organic cation transporter-like MFS transporter 4/5